MKKKIISILALVIFMTFSALAQQVTITPPSATIEPGESVRLTASGATYYQWSPAEGLSTTEGPSTTASPAVTTTYTCTGMGPGVDNVVNGNFDQGNVGFTSAYQYNSNLWNEGTYYVDSDASLHHENFVGLGHGGSGNFMMVNGATLPGTKVWTEEITVVPNKYYAFSTWVCTLAGQANEVALLQFSINGEQIGEVFSAPAQTNEWMEFYELWYSGDATTASITILNQNTVGSGNDFGLDDISFRELVVLGEPQCTVTVNNFSASATADDSELCEGESTTLHALPSGGSGNYTYRWSPAATLDDPTAQHPVATPEVGTTTYTCHVSDGVGSADISVRVMVFPVFEQQFEESICAYEVYDFFGQQLNTSGQYQKRFETEHGCDSVYLLDLTVFPANDTLLVDASICVGQTYNFHGTLYDQDGQTAYFDTIDQHGCRKVEKLYLTVGQYQVPPVEMQYECYEQGSAPSWTWDKTGLTYTEDTYDEIVLDDPEGGCPIKYRLDLRFHEEFYHEDEVVTCDEYTWPVTGETYSETQEIVKTFHNDFGDQTCDSTYVLRLDVSDSPHPTEIFAVDTTSQSHWVIAATEFQINYYDFYLEYLEDTHEIWHWDSVRWEFENPDVEWNLYPDSTTNPVGMKCRMYVLDFVEDTIWLRATVYNPCKTEGVSRRYWVLCSFYGVDEQVDNVQVYPNPTQGMVTIEAADIEQVRVIDMLGQTVGFEIYENVDQAVFNLQNLMPAVYMLEIKTGKGTLMKRIVVSR